MGQSGERRKVASDVFTCVCPRVYHPTHMQSDTSQTPFEMERVMVDSNPRLLRCLK